MVGKGGIACFFQEVGIPVQKLLQGAVFVASGGGIGVAGCNPFVADGSARGRDACGNLG